MKEYMLISVAGREIMTEQFDTHKEAFEQMKKEMVEQGRVPVEIFDNDEYEDYNCGFWSDAGYANDGINHEDYDWRIIKL